MHATARTDERVVQRFDALASIVNERVDDPSQSGVERYVGLEHLDSDSLRVRRWGTPTDVEATKLLFRKGDILFGRRRVYQRKLAVVDFDGICSAHAMVLRAKPSGVVPEFLPFFMQSDQFMERAKEISVGSLSPTINWETLAEQEFTLPPLYQQTRLAEVLQALLDTHEAYRQVATSLELARDGYALQLWGEPSPKDAARFEDLCVKIQDGTHFSPRSHDGEFLYVTSKNIRNGHLDLATAGRITKDEHDVIYARCDVQYGDILLTKDGANAGNVAINNVNEPFSLLSSVALIRPDPKRLLGPYLFEYLRSRVGRARILAQVKGSAISRLTLTEIRRLTMPVPSLIEQAMRCERFRTLEAAISASVSRSVDIGTMYRSLLAALETR